MNTIVKFSKWWLESPNLRFFFTFFWGGAIFWQRESFLITCLIFWIPFIILVAIPMLVTLIEDWNSL